MHIDCSPVPSSPVSSKLTGSLELGPRCCIHFCTGMDWLSDSADASFILLLVVVGTKVTSHPDLKRFRVLPLITSLLSLPQGDELVHA